METAASSSQPPPPTAPPALTATPSRQLTRSQTDRVAAGVAGGLGHYFDVDPIVFRVAFVVLALIGGSGVALYVAGWLLLPEVGQRESLAAAAWHGRGGRRQLLWTIILIGVGAALLADTFRPWRLGGITGPLVLIGLGGLVLYSSNSTRSGVGSQPVAPPADPVTSAASAVAADASTIDTPGAPAFDAPAGGLRWSPPVPSAPVIARPASLTPFLLGGLAVLGGLAALVDLTDWFSVSMPGLFSVALVLTGATIIAGAVRRRVGGLVVVAVLLATALGASLAVPSSLGDGVGTQMWHPLTAAAVQPVYRLGVGSAVLDLRDVSLSGPLVDVRASVGVGHLQVIVPSGAGVRVRARSGVGQTAILGNRVTGVSIDRTTVDGRGGIIDVRIDVQVGVGQVEVERAG